MPISSLVVQEIMTREAHCHYVDIGSSLPSQNKNAVVIWYHESLELHQNFLLAIKNDFHITQMQSSPAWINSYNQKLKPNRLIIQSSWVICKILYWHAYKTYKQSGIRKPLTHIYK